MPHPPVRSANAALGASLAAIAAFALPVAAQRPPEVAPAIGFSLWVDAVLGALFTLFVGGMLIALAPEYTDRTTNRVHEAPVETFLYGLLIFVAAVVVAVLLAVTIVGIVLVVPLVVALLVVGQIGYLAVGRAVVDELGPALLLAVVLSAVASGVPYLGGLVGFVLASMGTGAWYLDYRDDGASAGGAPGVDPVSGEAAGTAGRSGSAETGGGDGFGDDDGDAWTAGFDDRPDRE